MAKRDLNEGYKAFISYSREGESELAENLQHAVISFDRRVWRTSRLKVFLDRENMSGNASLWPSLYRLLDASEYLILLASPSSAKSGGVTKEITYWLENKPKAIDNLIVILADGEIIDPTSKEYLGEGSALPEPLWGLLEKSESFRSQGINYLDAGIYKEEPPPRPLCWLKPIKTTENRYLIARIVSTLLGHPNVEVLVKKQIRIFRIQVGLTLGVLCTVLVALAFFALSSAERSKAEADKLNQSDLSSEDLTGLKIREEEFHRVRFDSANFTGSTLVDIRFLEASGTDTEFVEASISNVDFVRSSFKGSSFSCQDVRAEACRGSRLINVQFLDGSRLADANFSFSELNYVTFRNVDLKGASFIGVNGSNVLFENVDLRGSNLVGLSEATFIDICFDEKTRWPRELEETPATNRGASCK